MRLAVSAIQPVLHTLMPLARHAAVRCLSEEEEEEPELLISRGINFGFDTFSWAFAPLILLLGLSLAFATGRGADGGPIRIGPPRNRDPLSFSAAPRATLDRPPTVLSLATLVALAPDDVLRDLQDEPAVRNLQLPRAEQAKQQALQDLEDERLTRCRSSSAFEFDQCFFFGSMGAADARRPMEGAGTLGRTSGGQGGAGGGMPVGGASSVPPARKLPTW